MLNEMAWIPLFFTFWGYFISMFSVFATMKAATYYEWQIAACVSTEIGHSLNLAIMPLFWGLLWPGIAQMGWHWNTWQIMMHMVTLHSVPFISTTINIAVTDMKILRKDTTKVLIAGYAYMFTNLFGQFYYGQPCYAFTDWVSSPLGTISFCVIAITVVSFFYWCSTYLVDMWAKEMGSDESDENEDTKEQLFIDETYGGGRVSDGGVDIKRGGCGDECSSLDE